MCLAFGARSPEAVECLSSGQRAADARKRFPYENFPTRFKIAWQECFPSFNSHLRENQSPKLPFKTSFTERLLWSPRDVSLTRQTRRQATLKPSTKRISSFFAIQKTQAITGFLLDKEDLLGMSHATHLLRAFAYWKRRRCADSCNTCAA